MTVIFDTSQVPPGQREQVVRGALAASAATMNVHFQCSPDEISYRLQHWQFGKAEMLQGSGFHAQNGFTRHESPGDLSVLDFTLPWQTGLSQSAVAGTVIFQAEDLGLPVDIVRRAAPLLPGSPVYGLLQDHLARLSQDADGITDPRHAAMVGKATTELARALVASAGQDELGANDTWHETLDTRLTTYLEHHLTDADLCAEALARVHHISVRQLYKLWSRGESPSQWIIHERLEGASRDLSAPSKQAHDDRRRCPPVGVRRHHPLLPPLPRGVQHVPSRMAADTSHRLLNDPPPTFDWLARRDDRPLAGR
jgi:AraC-like DNA-binding protein